MTFMRNIAGRALYAAVFLSAMLTTASAFAHAHLQQQIPAADSTVSVSPQALTLTFSEGVELSFSGVTLSGPQNKPVATGKLARSDGNKAQLTLPLNEPLAAGEYTVEWHVVSVDGHKTKGQYHFSVK
ncbi:CopC domain-containing protein YobA [Klebsiella aerogenes]|nr:CopC domain-containing protein YobA [Klebsiella aerogenes]